MLSSTSSTASTTAQPEQEPTRMHELAVGIHGIDLYIPKKVSLLEIRVRLGLG
jgi:hypothetical protein